MPVQSANGAPSKMAVPQKMAFEGGGGGEDGALPETEVRLRCENVHSVRRALKQAEDFAVASWLFANHTQRFHHSAQLSPRAFDSSLVVHAEQRLTNLSGGWPTDRSMGSNEGSADGAELGKDLLLVPARLFGAKLVGYSFGGASEIRTEDFCPYGAPTNALLPHHVGRFSFDVANNDLVIVAHNVRQNATGIISVRGGTQRERALYVVPAAAYDQEKLPSRVLSMTFGTELRENWRPKYQFALGAEGRDEWRWTIEALARLERMLKGRFVCANMRRDDMDDVSGEVLNRRTAATKSEFDVKDAVSTGVFRDMATRCYYSYMARAEGAFHP